MFKIIGIRIHKDCDANIRKVLKEERSYFIYNDYEDSYDPKDESIWIGIKHNDDVVETIPPDDFYRLKENNGGPDISVSAIVGKNGSGKSSLIEVVIRILNNFAIEAGFVENQSSLIKVKGLKATLFYSLDESIYYIECDDEKCIWRKNNTIISFQETNAKDTLRSHSKEIFYTIITNYSMFAYNSLNFQSEDIGIQEDGESWIASLFHKNDSYQTPVVLNPMRTKGNFDVNKEKDLTTQRLLALFTDAGNVKLFMAQKALGYVYSLEKESKLLTVSIDSFCRKTYQKKAYRSGSFSSDFSKDFDIGFDLKYQLDVWIEYEDRIRENKDLFIKVNERIRGIEKDFSPTDTDLMTFFSKSIHYLEEVKTNQLELNNGLCGRADTVLPSLKEFSAFFKRKCPLINFLQFQRLLLIIEIWDCWKKKRQIDHDLSIIDALESQDPRHHAMLYLVYKTISIFETYGNRYYFNSTITESNVYLLELPNEFNSTHNRLIEEFDKLYESLSNGKSFETLKLRQTIHYLKYNTADTSQKQNFCGYDYYMSFEQLLQKTDEIKKEDDSLKTIELLPPPIFVGDILFSANSSLDKQQSQNAKQLKKVGKSDDNFTLKMKSSGEQQLLFNVGTLIYHLRNLDSSTNGGGNIAYSNVSIILDEVELYFHPEYQRQYIKYLLDSIANAGLEKIKNISICCITHSPFILSDVPKNNVLFLGNGYPVRTMQEDTFGANIHTILQNGFFLDSLPIGEFAKFKINELFDELHHGRIDNNTYKLIQLVSEPVLKSQLLRLYHQLSPDTNQKIKELKGEIELLKEEIEKLKTDRE